MIFRQFLDVVPKSVKTLASVIAGGAVVACLIGAMVKASTSGRISAHGASFPVLASILVPALFTGLVVGLVIATWILGLGYVYADARRRNMPPILWTLIAAFIPNLLGFLLYFALRRPITLPCPQCGQATTEKQRFCSWCGYQGSSALSSQAS
jgi:hypothetical protein